MIGVRGHADPVTKEAAPEENDESFDLQLQYCFKTLEAHLQRDGNTTANFVRVDAMLRAARFIPKYDAGALAYFGGKLPFCVVRDGRAARRP